MADSEIKSLNLFFLTYKLGLINNHFPLNINSLFQFGKAVNKEGHRGIIVFVWKKFALICASLDYKVSPETQVQQI